MTYLGRQLIRSLYFPLILTFFIVYALYFEHLKTISVIIRNIAPIVILIAGAILVYADSSQEARLLRMRGELEKTLILSNYDIYLMYVLMALVPLGVLFISIYSLGGFGFVDFLQAVIAFAPVYWIRMRYFHYRYKRGESGNFELEDSITVTYYDSMKLDAISFLSSIIIMAIPSLVLQRLHISDIFQSMVAFGAIYWINSKYFKFS